MYVHREKYCSLAGTYSWRSPEWLSFLRTSSRNNLMSSQASDPNSASNCPSLYPGGLSRSGTLPRNSLARRSLPIGLNIFDALNSETLEDKSNAGKTVRLYRSGSHEKVCLTPLISRCTSAAAAIALLISKRRRNTRVCSSLESGLLASFSETIRNSCSKMSRGQSGICSCSEKSFWNGP
jgi:hypothetical protein